MLRNLYNKKKKNGKLKFEKVEQKVAAVYYFVRVECNKKKLYWQEIKIIKSSNFPPGC